MSTWPTPNESNPPGRPSAPRYTTHPAVVAAATIVGVTTCIGIAWAIPALTIGRLLPVQAQLWIGIGAIVVGYLVWRLTLAVMRDVVNKDE